MRGWIESYRDLPPHQPVGQRGALGDADPALSPARRIPPGRRGITARHAEEAIEETERMLEVYRRFAEEWLAIPGSSGHQDGQ